MSTPMYTRFVWEHPQGPLEYVLTMNSMVVPPQHSMVTTRFPFDGVFKRIKGQVSEVAVDYTQNEVIVHLRNVEML